MSISSRGSAALLVVSVLHIALQGAIAGNLCLANKCYDRHAACDDSSGSVNCGTCAPGFEPADYVNNPDSSALAPRACVPSNNINICTKAPYLTPRIWITCRDSDGCHNGFKWDGSLQRCIDRDECLDTPGICGSTAKCINIPWSYACSCPDINDHYPGGAYPGSFTFDDTTKKCVDATASPKCEYGTFRSNGACVDDPCLDANFNNPCGANQVCTAATDGSTYTCTCRGLLASGVCNISPAWDMFLVLYNAPFNPLSPLTNAVAANDDLGSTAVSGFTVNLVAGNVYVLVATAFSSSGSGAYTISSTPSSAIDVGICV
ncbi:hypothetical protein HXX76_010902 [Chlamydomonas incerta]|uniref:EGF-like domain-containing protein n=1 Tax=Chlamydomonas incerta TaxID=51695 RepID=A0A835VVA8_CHLIN|nr:hypothetical protein HXX76_010902 [Chlamydomonas incerta]|eukprot:KAG2427183.1 hypothetical protein HXX76_010902 [Chlamydomonas incerta]